MKGEWKLASVASILVPRALRFCGDNLLVAALAAQCSNPTQVPNQTISSGTYNFPDDNALSATNVINDSASVTFVAGNGIQLHPGFHAIAGLAATTVRVGGNSDIRCVRFAFERNSPQCRSLGRSPALLVTATCPTCLLSSILQFPARMHATSITIGLSTYCMAPTVPPLGGRAGLCRGAPGRRVTRIAPSASAGCPTPRESASGNRIRHVSIVLFGDSAPDPVTVAAPSAPCARR